MSLFDSTPPSQPPRETGKRPLAERMRPKYKARRQRGPRA